VRKAFFIIAILAVISLFVFPAMVSANGFRCLTITTLPATDIYSSQATLKANVVSMGDCIWTDVTFRYGTSPGVYTNVTNAVRSTGTGIVSIVAANLNPCTMYYFQAAATCPVILQLPPQGKWFTAGVDTGALFRNTPMLPADCIASGQELSFGTGGCDHNLFNTGGGTGSSGGVGAGGTVGTTTTTPTVPLANIRVQNVSLSASKVGIGEQVQVTTTVFNNGNSNGGSKITLYVNGQETTYQGITLNAGEARQLSFNVFRNEPGVYQVTVNGFPAGSFTVDYFTNNHALIYSIIALFVIVIGGLLFLLSRRIT